MLLPLHLNGLNLDSGTAVAVISGTAADANESLIVAGGQTIIITLTNDTFVAAGTGPIGSTANTQALIDGLTADGVELLGWNNEVRDNELTTSVVRTSDTVATITLSAAANYNITVDETITATIPADVLTGAVELTGTPTFDVLATVVSSNRAGKPKRKSRRRYVVEVDGQVFEVNDIDQAIHLLEQAVVIAREEAPKQARKVMRKQLRKKRPPKEAKLKVPEIMARTHSVELQPILQQFRTEIDRIYRQAAQSVETQLLIRRRLRDQDEEDAITTLLLM